MRSLFLPAARQLMMLLIMMMMLMVRVMGRRRRWRQRILTLIIGLRRLEIIASRWRDALGLVTGAVVRWAGTSSRGL